MTPSIDIRLASMIRSMQDVIVPAIDPSNSLACEQASLMIGHLNLLEQHWRRIFPYAQVCLDDLCTCASTLEPDGGPRTQGAAVDLDTAIARDATDPEKKYQDCARALEALVRAAAEDGTPAFQHQLESEVLAFSQRQVIRDRAWFAQSGFDIDSENLPSIDEVISGAVNSLEQTT
ncbi:MAG: hypothetical protein KDE63_01065 [Novosphingobium sp.]|nr:hypothetical protein [Novosphingobium sp.]